MLDGVSILKTSFSFLTSELQLLRALIEGGGEI